MAVGQEQGTVGAVEVADLEVDLYVVCYIRYRDAQHGVPGQGCRGHQATSGGVKVGELVRIRTQSGVVVNADMPMFEVMAANCVCKESCCVLINVMRGSNDEDICMTN